jgi:hypothetical protein
MANSNLETTTPAPSPTRTVTLLTLPTELLINISQNLCLHCRVPRIGEVPSHDAATGIREQTALAHLSASSQLLRAVAQPILFHFFHCLADHTTTNYRLLHFVHTLCHRPDLASSVKSLVLWTPTHDHESSASSSDDHDHDHDHDRDHDHDHDDDHDKTQQAVDLPLHDPAVCTRAAAERLGSWWAGWQGSSLAELQELAMALTSGALDYLLLQRSFDGRLSLRGKAWPDWAHPMGRLKHVVLVGWRYHRPFWRGYTFHVKHARALLGCAREVESLVAVDCGVNGVGQFVVTDQDRLKALPWDVELPRLRRLSISGKKIRVEEVEAIIRHSTVFEDLEFFHTRYRHGLRRERDVLDLETHLGTAKKTLKRLCYSVFRFKVILRGVDIYDEHYEPSESDDDRDLFDPNRHGLGRVKAGFSLKNFSVLETLELEQLVLYGPVFEKLDNGESDRSCELVTTDQFLEKFPPSLMRLRIGCIFYWPIVFRDMLTMAEERARFPNLRSVTLEVCRIPPREEFDYLVDAFRRAGIALSVCSVLKDPFSRGLLPTRPGFPVRLPKPVTYT